MPVFPFGETLAVEDVNCFGQLVMLHAFGSIKPAGCFANIIWKGSNTSEKFIFLDKTF